MAEADDRVRSHLDTLRSLEAQREARDRARAEEAALAEAEAEEAVRAGRRDSWQQELARKAALEQQEAHAVAQRQAQHRQKMDSLRVTTQQQANDVEQSRLYEHESEMKNLQAQEKKKVGWAPSLLALLAVGALAAGAWYGVFMPMREEAARQTALERQKVVDENLKRQQAERAKEEAARSVAQEEERLRRTKTAAAAAAQDDDERQTERRTRRRRSGGGGDAEAQTEETPSRGPALPGDEDPLLGI